MSNKNSKDHLIEELINSPIHRIHKNGFVEIKTNEGWRNLKFHSPRLKKGYCEIKFKGKYLYIHRIIYAKFIGPLNEKLVINHKDGNGFNNTIENLELISQAENNLHRFRVLNHPPVRGNKKISSEIADRIREKRKQGYKYTELMEEFELCKSSISYIVNNKSWNF